MIGKTIVMLSNLRERPDSTTGPRNFVMLKVCGVKKNSETPLLKGENLKVSKTVIEPQSKTSKTRCLEESDTLFLHLLFPGWQLVELVSVHLKDILSMKDENKIRGGTNCDCITG